MATNKDTCTCRKQTMKQFLLILLQIWNIPETTCDVSFIKYTKTVSGPAYH